MNFFLLADTPVCLNVILLLSVRPVCLIGIINHRISIVNHKLNFEVFKIETHEATCARTREHTGENLQSNGSCFYTSYKFEINVL